MSAKNEKDIPARTVLIALVLAASMVLWYRGFLTSPVLVGQTSGVHTAKDGRIQAGDPVSELDRELARAYWRRYPDVKNDPHYGTDGPTGIHGARAHFRQHGKREGRTWGLEPAPSADQKN